MADPRFNLVSHSKGGLDARVLESGDRDLIRREVTRLVEGEKEKLLKDMEYIKKNIAGQNTLQAKGKLKRLTRVVQAIEQFGMEAVVNTNWSQLGVETTTSPFGVEEAERRVRAAKPPKH